jgi:uracil phosphoribosyltransferase/phosphoserine phosphatase
VVVGIYGVSGVGKSFFMNQLKMSLGEVDFIYFEGSDVIADIVDGGLPAFKKSNDEVQEHFRASAIEIISNKCRDSGKTGIVTGHYLLWDEGKECVNVCTPNDLAIYSHMLYLDMPPAVIVGRRREDIIKRRAEFSVGHLRKWQETEKKALREACQCHGILYCSLSSHLLPLGVEKLLRDFSCQNVYNNLLVALGTLDGAIVNREQLKMVVFDADRTLNAEDTGAMFWKRISLSSGQVSDDSSKTPAQAVFEGPMGYTYNAFRQVTLLHEEVLSDDDFDSVCKDVASSVTIHPEILSLLQCIAEDIHVGAVIVTCGLAKIWENVLEREGLLGKIKIIGGGRIDDGFVVTADVKEALVAHLQNEYCMEVWAFGDSPLDLKMLCKADRAVVVVGEEATRSKTMTTALMKALEAGDLKANQCLLPSSASPRLTRGMLPKIKLSDPLFIGRLLSGSTLRVKNADALNSSTTKILMTPMRDSRHNGPMLREAHRRVGEYLAIQFMSEIIGIEEYMIPHSQGKLTPGYRLLHEKQTLIVTLMRAGEAMALGVNDAFPLAIFLHAKEPEDIKPRILENIITIALVDSVINSGTTILRFIEYIRKIHATVRIVVVTGVLQAQCVAHGEEVARALASHIGLHIVTLRISKNKYKGTGGTDTGNRLFNTVHLA